MLDTLAGEDGAGAGLLVEGGRDLARHEMSGHDALGIEPIVGGAEQGSAAARAVPERAGAERQPLTQEASAHHPAQP